MAVASARGCRLAAACDMAVHLPLERELCPFDLAPVTSTAAQMLFGDTVAIALMQARRPHPRSAAPCCGSQLTEVNTVGKACVHCKVRLHAGVRMSGTWQAIAGPQLGCADSQLRGRCVTPPGCGRAGQAPDAGGVRDEPPGGQDRQAPGAARA